MTALASRPVAAIGGETPVPGDKSISHRALMLSAVAVGRTEITGLLEGDDVLRTAAALSALGVPLQRAGDGAWRVDGVGVGGLAEPDDVLDLGNSGTGARLLMGLLATHDLSAHFTGDASLRRRPMARIAEPIERMGAEVIARDGGRMPLLLRGAAEPVPIVYELPMPSAQVKSAVLLAGLNAPGRTSVVETLPSRDHTELMLRHFGADVTVEDVPDGRRIVTVTGEPELAARPVVVPGDISSAAFAIVAALIVPGSSLTIRNVGLNPLRAGVIETLGAMGADIALEAERVEAGERVADLVVRHTKLKGVTVPAERAPRMIDEYPVLAVAAACAAGRTEMRGLGELRVKESDRLAAIAAGLAACGVGVTIEGDTLTVDGAGGRVPGGGRVATHFDHRIAMAFLVLGLAAERPVSIDDQESIGTSFPGFVDLMNGIGAEIAPAHDAAAE